MGDKHEKQKNQEQRGGLASVFLLSNRYLNRLDKHGGATILRKLGYLGTVKTYKKHAKSL